MTCPHCAAFTKETFPKLKATYIDTGKMRYVFREFPLDQVALLGAVLARCIAKGDPPKFLRRDRRVVRKPERLGQRHAGRARLKRVTKQLGLNDQDFEACANNETIAKGIIATRDYAYDRLKVNATPSFFINGQLLPGEASLEEFAKIIDPCWCLAAKRVRLHLNDRAAKFGLTRANEGRTVGRGVQWDPFTDSISGLAVRSMLVRPRPQSQSRRDQMAHQ